MNKEEKDFYTNDVRWYLDNAKQWIDSAIELIHRQEMEKIVEDSNRRVIERETEKL